MRDLAMRGLSTPRALWLVLPALALVSACGGAKGPPQSHEVMYLRDAPTRRQALVDELVTPTNGYSTLRLAHYATGTDGDWDALPAWNPRAASVPASALDGAQAGPVLPADAQAFSLPDEAAWDPTDPSPGPPTLASIGQDAFFRYPAQLAPPALAPLTRDAADRYGLWVDEVRGVGGIVVAETDAGPALAFSCASCHADVIDGRVVVGVPSARVNLGRMLADSGASGAVAANLLAWGPGRNDVTTSDASLPERVSDLRPVRFYSHLQYDATVKQIDLVSLAVRVETLIITSNAQAVRPPRVVALAHRASTSGASRTAYSSRRRAARRSSRARRSSTARARAATRASGSPARRGRSPRSGPIRRAACRPIAGRATTACRPCAASRSGRRCSTTARSRTSTSS